MAVRRIVLEALSPVVELARAAIADLEPRDVPTAMRRVAAAQGGRLAPPLQWALVSELDTNEWLRGKVVERLGDAPDPLVAAFLERRDGWWEVLAARVVEIASREGTRRAERSDRALRDAEESLAEARRRLEAASSENGEVVRHLREQLTAARAETRQADHDQEVVSLRADLTQARAEVTEADLARISAESELAEANRKLLRVRRGRDGRRIATATASLPRDPVELARLLDHQSSLSERTVDAPSSRNRAEDSPFRLPHGMSPEAPEAVWWALAVDPPGRFIVDGYNVLFHVDDRRDSAGATRLRLNQGLRRIRRQAGGRAAVTVVYDSSLGGDRRRRSAVDGIEIRFAEEGVTADDEIVGLAASAGRAVVVSSDREVQERSAAAGAIVLWSEALAEVLRS